MNCLTVVAFLLKPDLVRAADSLQSNNFIKAFFVSVIFFLSFSPDQIAAQVEPPDRRFLFEEESDKARQQRAREIAEILKVDAPKVKDLDFKASDMEFLQETNEMKGVGGVLISREGMQIQAQEGYLNVDTKDTKLLGDVLFSWPEGEISCNEAELNLDTEMGDFKEAGLIFEEGDYLIRAGNLSKLSETKFSLTDSLFTTCHCSDGAVPWSINCGKADLEQEGYAHTYGTTLNLGGYPIIYSPYFLFPIKQERSSGLLAPEYGYSDRDGVKLDLPVFIVLDESTDMTVAPFVETETRLGSRFDFRRIFSKRSNITSRLIYSNESQRGDDLRGTNVDNVFDPTFDEDRFGVFVKQSWRSDPEWPVSLSSVADIHYISDDLFLRELEDDDIGKRTARFSVSRVLLRSGFSDFLSAELSGEYNQSITSDDDLIFQRYPEMDVNLSKSFRPFGFNPYGIKFVTSANLHATDFARKIGYDGWRYGISPGVRIPYHYRNYFYGNLDLKLHDTYYSLDNDIDPEDEGEVVEGDNRSVPVITYNVSTAFEKVFPLKEDSLLTHLTGLGAKNQNTRLRRVKHVIEPGLKYVYVPDVEQDDLPFFDSFDRFRQKNVVSYGVNTSLLGRFLPTNEAGEDIVELTPDIEDLPVIGISESLSDLDAADDLSSGLMKIRVRKGEIRELVRFSIKQTFDYLEDRENNDPERDPFSDVAISLGVAPTRSFAFNFLSDYDFKESNFSSWGLAAHFKDDWGDILRVRYSYVEDSVSQIEGNLEMPLSERLRMGFYGRFDEEESEFLENQTALRWASACDCWYLDFGYRETINPEREQFFLRFTFRGLGDVTQNMDFSDDE